MNKIKKVLIFTLIAGFAFNTLNTNAQAAQGAVTATASTTAEIIAPITIVKTADASFGIMSVNNSTGGTLSVSPTNTVATTGGVNAIGSGTTAGAFTVGGNQPNAYTLTIRETVMLRVAGDATTVITGAKVMPLSTFKITNNGGSVIDGTSQAPATGDGSNDFIGASAVFAGLSFASSESTILIGAKITLTSGQQVGIYTGQISVDVAYD